MDKKRPIVQEYSKLPITPTNIPESENQSGGKREKVEDNFLLSIVAVLCCFPFGILGLVASIKTRKSKRMNDMKKAREYSKWSRTCSLIGIVLGAILLILFVIFFVVVVIGVVEVGSQLTSEIVKCVTNATLCDFERLNKTHDPNLLPQFDQNESILMNTIDTV